MVKYTEEVLRKAVAASRSMADVMRNLSITPNGGSHAHLRRRLHSLGIDTSHFLGQAHARGQRSNRRLTGDEVFIHRPDQRRARPEILRRALLDDGVPYACAECGIGGSWNGKRLTLQVDHINGNPVDCTKANLRFLCPNCHSQSATYAGRNRRVPGLGLGSGSPSTTAVKQAQTPDDVVEIIRRVDAAELSVVHAARLIGCSRNHFYRLRLRLVQTGSVLPPKSARQTLSQTQQAAIIAYALSLPDKGPRKIAEGLPWRVSHGTVAAVLKTAGLNHSAARRRAAQDTDPAKHQMLS